MFEKKIKFDRNYVKVNRISFLFSTIAFCTIFCSCHSVFSCSLKCTTHVQTQKCNVESIPYNKDFAPKEVLPPVTENLSAAIHQVNLKKDNKDSLSHNTEVLNKKNYDVYKTSDSANIAVTYFDGPAGFLIHKQLNTNA